MSPRANDPKASPPAVMAYHHDDRTVAVAALERALGLPPAELTAQVDVAE